MQVTATDGDKDRPQNIVYFLTGQGIDPDNPANSKFDINRTTGEIFVLKVNTNKTFYSVLVVNFLLFIPEIELNGNNFPDFVVGGRTCRITLIYVNILKQIESEGKILFYLHPNAERRVSKRDGSGERAQIEISSKVSFRCFLTVRLWNTKISNFNSLSGTLILFNEETSPWHFIFS